MAQFSGKPVPESSEGRSIKSAIEVFEADKKNEGVSPTVAAKYKRELKRFRAFCEGRRCFTLPMITRELVIEYATTWESL